jgi:hypothetical protein
MQSANRFALKEWAVVCRALGCGRQSLILRKGGIDEGPDGFQVEHGEFWLFPTAFHQEPDRLINEAGPLMEETIADLPPEGTVRILHYIVAEQVVRIDEESLLARLAGLHIWSEATLRERFHYRTPGLFAILVRVFALPRPIELPDATHFAGCRSWVDFPDELPTQDLTAVHTDIEHSRQVAAFQSALSPPRLT